MIEQQYLQSKLNYNPKTGEFIWLNPPKGHPDLKNKNAGSLSKCRNNNYYKVIQIDGMKYKSSYLAFIYMKGYVEKDVIDHINGITTDDRYDNLREATFKENCRNIHSYTKKSGLPLGVKKLSYGKYQARITIDGKCISLGVYNSETDAHNVYIERRRLEFGRYNCL